MNDVKISVILPIYNVEDYIEETLDSLLNQSMIDDMEVLMVDDGSTDSSRYIIEKYALDHDNFHAFHKENEGLAMTRNYGIERASGEYIHFLDSDDVIAVDGYEKLYQLAVKNDSDIVTANFTKFGRYNSWMDVLSKRIFANIDCDVDSTTLNEMRELVWDTISTNKIYKREFLNRHNILFPDKRIVYEDIPFSLRAYILADRISVYYNIFYYWRVRKSSKLSLTQQRTNMTNFNDRMEIIEMCGDVLDEENVDDSLKRIIYEKWINHDFFLFLKKFYLFPDESSEMIVERINEFRTIMPDDVMNNLNSFKKIIYKMVEDRDIEGLRYMSSLNDELMENPHVPSDLDEKYVEYIDFVNDAAKEELTAKNLETVEHDGENIYLEFEESINYLDKNHPHETEASLVSPEGNEYPLNVKDNVITIPLDIIRESGHSNIKMVYSSEEFKKESYLKNSKRQIINYEGFDVEIGTESNRLFCIDQRLTNDNEIMIEEITFEYDILTFTGTSIEEIDSACLQNVVTFEKFHYPVVSDKTEEGFGITFSIPHEDIISYPIDKWEVRVDKTFKSIQMPRRFEFYTSNNKIRIINARNKILIENDLYNKFERLHEFYEEIYRLKNVRDDLKEKNRNLKEKNDNLINENKEIKKKNRKVIKENKKLSKNNTKLQKKNEDLNNLVEEYKSRFVVKSADKINHIIKRNE